MKIYIYLHANYPSGGTELLYQLCDSINNELPNSAYLYCHKSDYREIEQYSKYNYAITHEIEDLNFNTLIYPEAAWIRSEVSKYKKISKMMWWMSVDNYIKSKCGRELSARFFQAADLFNKTVLKKKSQFKDEFLWKKYISDGEFNILNHDSYLREANVHLCQSNYAYETLERLGFKNLMMLSDYLNEEFCVKSGEWYHKNKENIVVYNPAKGLKVTKNLIKSLEGFDVTFIPLSGMTRNEAIELLGKAKLYIDFGNHPGKDRIPREAACMGCCVITNTQGSARTDINIPEKYRFKAIKVDLIKKQIIDVIENYDNHITQFLTYRNIIMNEKSVFDQQVKNLILNITKND